MFLVWFERPSLNRLTHIKKTMFQAKPGYETIFCQVLRYPQSKYASQECELFRYKNTLSLKGTWSLSQTEIFLFLCNLMVISKIYDIGFQRKFEFVAKTDFLLVKT